jgi:hypothetical protein
MSELDQLSARDVEIVQECLIAAVHGPFFPDEEFHTLMGLTRAEVQQILAGWPAVDETDAQDLAVNNVLNNLLGYPHQEWDCWRDYVSAEPAEVAAILARWRGEDDLDTESRGYFDRLR